MAFTVEDGSGVTGANSYLSLTDAGTYHSDRGNTTWAAATEAARQAALIEATEYLEAHYEWADGVKATSGQGLSWPRTGATDKHGYLIDSDEVPQAVQDATAYLALKALTEELGKPLKRALKRLKAGSTELEWNENGPESKRFPLVDGWLAGLVRSGGSVQVSLV